MTRLLSRLSYANVMATLAFFLAVSGATAGAAALVTGADIRDRSITGADVRNHSLSAVKLKRSSVTGFLVRNQSLTSADLKDGSVRAADFNPGDLQQFRGSKGDPGPKGDTGPQGPQGAAGVPGSSDIVRLSSTGPDASGYVNNTPLIQQLVSTSGGWLMLARMNVSNTGGSDDWFNCGLAVDGRTLGGGGDNVQAGTTKEIDSLAFGPVDAGQQVVLSCEGGGSTTFDVSNVRLSIAKLM
jgi:hypothetical protein